MALAAGILLLAAVAPQAVQRVFVINPVEVQGIPNPEQLVRIKLGQQYVVPGEKMLVITGVVHETGLTSSNGYRVMVDGIQVLGGIWGNLNNGGNPDVFFWGYRVEPDSVVEIQSTTSAQTPWFILGYLADK